MTTKFIAPFMAFAALASAQSAQAQQPCVEPADLSDAVTYAVPILYEGLQSPCAATFAANPFMANEAGAMVDGFRAQQNAAWPGTMRLLKVFMAADANSPEGGENPMMAAVAELPEESLRPIVDMIVGQMVGEQLGRNSEETCGTVAEAMELLAPLPPENVGKLASFIARQAELDDPSICGVTPKTTGE